VVDLEHKLSVSGEQHLATIDQQKQVDLFLFYKECLINCCRHSDATELSTRLVVGTKTTLLTVTDNGSSPADHGALDLPPSLKRRAKILGAHVTLTHPDEGGWRISLRLRNKRRWPRLLRAGK
jgi:signal transduction histidine kinase